MAGHKSVSYNQKPQSKVPLYVDTNENQNPQSKATWYSIYKAWKQGCSASNIYFNY